MADINGTSGDDTLVGTATSDEILGLDGDDYIDGAAGNDVIDGGAGDDTIFGNDGDDAIRGGDGDDIIHGGDGADRIHGGRGDDIIYGGDGADRIYGGRGDDAIDGDDGDDRIRGGRGDDTIDGGDGADRIHGGRGDDAIDGDDGADRIHGGRGDDVIDGGDGADRIHGGRGDDEIFGGDSADGIRGGRGDDAIEGGDGADKIKGGAGNDVIDGGAGDDTIFGNDGDDMIHGGTGDDIIYGDNGSGSGSGSGHGHGSDGSGSGSGAQASGSGMGYGSDGSGSDGSGAQASGSGSGSGMGYGSDGSGSGSGAQASGSGMGYGSDGSGSGSGMGYGSDGSGSDGSGAQASGSGSGSGHGHGSDGSGSGSGCASASGSGPVITFNDYLNGGAGNDQVFGEQGDDWVAHVASDNVGATDQYDGGLDYDTLELQLTGGELADAQVQADIAAFLDFLALNSDVTSDTNEGPVFAFTAFDLTARNFENLVVTNTGGNEPPVATDDTAATDEDNPIVIDALLNDTDPDGGLITITDVTSVPGGTVTIDGGGNLVFTPDPGFSGTTSFEYTITDDTGLTDSATVVVEVTPVADAPDLTATNATGDEDTAIPLSIAAALNDLDGSESLSDVTVSGVPTGASLSAGADLGGGVWSLTQAELAGLTVTPPADSDVDFTLQLSVTSTEAANGDTATTTAALDVTVNAVADAPTLTTTGAAGDEDTAIPLTISSALTDVDGSEALSLAISGVPSGATLSAGTDQGGGVWSLLPGDLAGLAVTPPAGSDADFTLIVSSTSAEQSNGDTATTTASLDVIVNAVADVPALTATSAAGDEDTAIPLAIAAALNDLDGSESLSNVTVSGVPTGAILSAATLIGVGGGRHLHGRHRIPGQHRNRVGPAFLLGRGPRRRRLHRNLGIPQPGWQRLRRLLPALRRHRRHGQPRRRDPGRGRVPDQHHDGRQPGRRLGLGGALGRRLRGGVELLQPGRRHLGHRYLRPALRYRRQRGGR